MTRLRFAQIGTRHGHAAGKWRALLRHPDVDAVGIFEPDASRRQRDDRFPEARWFTSLRELLETPELVAVAVEGRNHESLAMAAAAVEAGKHVWLDKPAGDDWPGFQRLMAAAADKKLHVQLGYMFRYSPNFIHIAELARSGQLGDIFGVRAHMSTHVDLAERTEQSRHLGGIFYDLGGHMLDQIVWLLGRPLRVARILRNDATPELATYSDNTLVTFEFPNAFAIVDIAAMESPPTARRFEVYGTHGSVILDGFDPPTALRVTHDRRQERVELPVVQRQELYERELPAFVAVVRGERPADRGAEHELLVQETLLRATGRIG